MKHLQILLPFIFLLFACGPSEQKVIEEDPVELPEMVEPVYLNEKEIKDYIISAATITPNTDCGEPFNKLVYDKVIAYDFDGRGDQYINVIQKGSFLPVIKEQKALSQEQVNFATSLFSDTLSYGGVSASCFDPHLGLVFYLNDTTVLQANICLDCGRLYSSIAIPAKKHVRVDIGEEYERALEGLSESAEAGIIDLSKELNFRYGNKQLQ